MQDRIMVVPIVLYLVIKRKKGFHLDKASLMQPCHNRTLAKFWQPLWNHL